MSDKRDIYIRPKRKFALTSFSNLSFIIHLMIHQNHLYTYHVGWCYNNTSSSVCQEKSRSFFELRENMKHFILISDKTL